MRIRLLLLSVYTILLTGCKDDFGSFQKQAATFAADKKIDQKEYEILIAEIKGSNDRKFTTFKTAAGDMDNAKLNSYLAKLFPGTDIAPADASVSSSGKFNIDVFLENSASMDGYVKGITEFETAIYNLLGDFKISGICDSLNLNYINRSIPYSKKNALEPDIQDFIEKLEPSVFKDRGGDRSVSDLKNILSTVLKTVNDKHCAVLISDFVFSPGSNADAQNYLNNQGVGIKIDFAQKLRSFDLSAIIIQLQSNFDGFYYDRVNNAVPLKCKRPYYIWIIGNTNQVSAILNQKMLNNIKGGYENRLVFQSLKGTNQTDYKILFNPKIGNFNLAEGASGPISHASISNEAQTRGQFGFTIAVDFSKSLQDPNYFADSANYELSNKKYSLKPEIITEKNNPALNKFTHKLSLETSELKEEPLEIDVVGKVPNWVINSTSIDDSRIGTDNEEKQKTFGFKYLVEGVNDAFYPKSNSNAINSITITIKK